jgi:hypothetical protein
LPRFILGNFDRWVPPYQARQEHDAWSRHQLHLDYEACWVFDQQSGRLLDLDSLTYLPFGDTWFCAADEYPDATEHMRHAASEVFCALFTAIVRAFPDFSFADTGVRENEPWISCLHDRLRPDIADSIRKQILTSRQTPYRVIGVDKAKCLDAILRIDALSEANARVKAELKGLIVTAVREDYPYPFQSMRDRNEVTRQTQQEMFDANTARQSDHGEFRLPLDP